MGDERSLNPTQPDIVKYTIHVKFTACLRRGTRPLRPPFLQVTKNIYGSDSERENLKILCVEDVSVLTLPYQINRTTLFQNLFLNFRDKTMPFSQNCAQPCQAHQN